MRRSAGWSRIADESPERRPARKWKPVFEDLDVFDRDEEDDDDDDDKSEP